MGQGFRRRNLGALGRVEEPGAVPDMLPFISTKRLASCINAQAQENPSVARFNELQGQVGRRLRGPIISQGVVDIDLRNTSATYPQMGRTSTRTHRVQPKRG